MVVQVGSYVFDRERGRPAIVVGLLNGAFEKLAKLRFLDDVLTEQVRELYVREPNAVGTGKVRELKATVVVRSGVAPLSDLQHLGCSNHTNQER